MGPCVTQFWGITWLWSFVVTQGSSPPISDQKGATWNTTPLMVFIVMYTICEGPILDA